MENRKVYVSVWLWAGDIPYITFTTTGGKTTFLIDGDSNRHFDIYREMKALPNNMEFETPSDYDQPPWAFIITNGDDELSLKRNAGDCMLSFRNKTTGKESFWSTISVAKAKELSESLDTCLERFPVKKDESRVEIKSLGSWVHYDARKISVSAPFSNN